MIQKKISEQTGNDIKLRLLFKISSQLIDGARRKKKKMPPLQTYAKMWFLCFENMFNALICSYNIILCIYMLFITPTYYYRWTGAILLFSASNINDWLPETGKPNLTMLTTVFFVLNFLAATQNIVIDGWALTMLKKWTRKNW